MEWLHPWWSTFKNSEQEEALERELRTEIGPGHPLFGVPVKVLGRDHGNDDALFQLLDGSKRVAVVHLTWRRVQDEPPIPLTEIYSSLEDWAEKRMRPDHKDFIES